MIFANVKELKNKTSEFLRATQKGEDVVVTLRGKPIAVIHSLTGDDIEDYILNHPKMKKKLLEAYTEYKRIGGKKLEDFIKEFNVSQ